MSRRKLTTFALMSLLTIGALVVGCDESNYDQRTVVYVSNINDGAPYFSDVLNQGDSIYYTDTDSIKSIDDYVEEDWIKVQIHNKPYSSLVDAGGSSLGDFLVTGYDVEFVRKDGGPTPVPPFSGETSILVPCNTLVEAVILFVPFSAKNDPTLVLYSLHYTGLEIMSYAHITFHGHEVQTTCNIDFSAGISVNFGDPLGKTDTGEE